MNDDSAFGINDYLVHLTFTCLTTIEVGIKSEYEDYYSHCVRSEIPAQAMFPKS